jgi:2-methylcitrate dehydratase PrpD
MEVSNIDHREQMGPAWAAAKWLSDARERELPAEVEKAAKTCLIDWFGCALGGLRDPVVSIVGRRIASFSSTGTAPLLSGGNTAPAFAALFHSTAAHATDFDDTHIWTDAHFGGPTWAAVLSQIGNTPSLSDQLMLRSFVAGFEVGTKMGGRRLGHAMVHRGFQATALLGRLAGAAACSVIAELDVERIAMALATAACQTAGLSTTAGTMMKPYQGGKTAFDAVLSVELASDGFTADPSLLDKGGGELGEKRIGGLAKALVQDGFAEFAQPDFSTGWEILRNSTKAYPCLHSLGPVVDAARELSPRIINQDVAKIRVYVGPSVPKIARYSKPNTEHEGRFSIEYCAVLGLLGYSFSPKDFSTAVMHSPTVTRLLEKVEVIPTEGRKMYNAALDVELRSGEKFLSDVPMGRGHPGRPLTEEELEEKFCMQVEPLLGTRTDELVSLLREFPVEGTVREAFEMVRKTIRKF